MKTAGPILSWRAMIPADLDAVCAVAAVAFPDHFEARAVFAERLDLFPRGCFVLAGPGGTIVGYAIAYPYPRDAVPVLNTLMEALTADPRVLYLHDMALAPDVRGRGLTGPVIADLAALARTEGLAGIALSALGNAVAFWAHQGFVAHQSPALSARLDGYGPDARYMVRAL